MTRVLTTTCDPSPRSIAPILLLSACLLVAGCGPASDQPAAQTSDTPAVPRLEPIATFGCSECDGPELLANPGITVGPSGRVHVVDTQEPHVRVLEPDGSLAFAIGASGEGPGEIRLPYIIGVLEMGDGSFWVQEGAFLHHFGADGTFLESESVPPRLPLGSAYDHDHGLIYVVAAPVPGSGAEHAPRRALLRLRPGQQDFETVAPWSLVSGMSEEEAAQSETRFSTLAVGPDGRLAIADIWNYRVRVLSPEGDLLQTFGRPELPRPPKDPDRLEREREIARQRGRDEPSPDGPHLGPRAAYDGAGRLWLHARRQPALLDVFAPDGAYLGEVALEGTLVESFPGLSAYGDRLAAVLTDDQGVARVHVFRIVDE